MKDAVQPSNHQAPEKPLPGFPDGATHAYTRQHKTTGLQAHYEGPFRIDSRVSRSVVRLEVGVYKDGQKRFELRHINDLKFAHPSSLAAEAQRPKLGRPGSSSTNTSNLAESLEPTDDNLSLSTNMASNRFSDPNPPAQKGATDKQTPAEIQTEAGNRTRPIRATRNQNPVYVDAISLDVTGPPPVPGFPTVLGLPVKQSAWSASQSDLKEINRSISRRRYA